jgi:dihydroneopterin aldolase
MSGDRILLTGLRVRCHHAVLPHYAQLGQEIVVDLELVVDLTAAGRSDDLDTTVDYGSLAGRVAEVVGGRPRKLLEAVAEDVAQLVLADERVRQVRVRVTKPQAPLPVDATVAVEITRDRETTGEGSA